MEYETSIIYLAILRTSTSAYEMYFVFPAKVNSLLTLDGHVKIRMVEKFYWVNTLKEIREVPFTLRRNETTTKERKQISRINEAIFTI